MTKCDLFFFATKISDLIQRVAQSNLLSLVKKNSNLYEGDKQAKWKINVLIRRASSVVFFLFPEHFFSEITNIDF